jgi:hypothetical protein
MQTHMHPGHDLARSFRISGLRLANPKHAVYTRGYIEREAA